ncbi:unnamed protein product, partial [marine sediment metagenome]
MNYLKNITLQVFLCLFYGNGIAIIPAIERIGKENFIKEIFENKFEEFFVIEKNGENFQKIDYKNFLSS